MADCANKPLLKRATFVVSTLLVSFLLTGSALRAAAQSTKAERPQLPFGFTALSPVEVGIYDSKAEPSAEILQAINVMTLRGWETIRKYYPELGVVSENASRSVNPGDPEDRRFFAAFVTEDPGRSPMPLVSMICSLDASEVSGRLKELRDELLEAMRIEDYSTWPADRLGQSIHELTQVQTTEKGVKYRAPKRTLSFKEAVRLYAMTVALLTKDTKWPQWRETARKLGYSLPPPPDMNDFTNRLRHQLPIIIPPGATRGMLLYRPGWDIAQPLSKEEYEERADVVLIKRSGTTFHVEQFPIYLNADQKTWSPPWIIPEDDWKDSTLVARKFEELWTRFDGPYMWYRSDQLNGEDTYRATVKFQKGDIVIEAERFVLRRGSVVRTARDRSYDPLSQKRFVAGAEAPTDPLTVDFPDFDMWPAMWRLMSKNINETSYRHDDRELFWYKTGENSFSSSIFPRKNGGATVVEPVHPVKTPSSGIVPRFSGSGAEQPSEVQLLTPDQQTSINIAAGLMNRCLENTGGSEVAAMRVSMPRDKENLTPIYFYSVKNSTSVRRSPNSLVVVLSEGYYNSYVSAFNRILWVLEKAFDNDASKDAAINHAIAGYLQTGLPKDATSQQDPAVIAWSEILRDRTIEQLFNASITPNAQKQAAQKAPVDAGGAAVAASPHTEEWLTVAALPMPLNGSPIDPNQRKSAEVALGLVNLYLADSSGPATETWRRWYPRGTAITFLVAASGELGSAKEEKREITSSEGERRDEVNVAVELPARAYSDYLSSLAWLLGVLEVNARGRTLNGPSTPALGGQGTGVSNVLEYLRNLDVSQESAAIRDLSQKGVNWKTLSTAIPDVPSLFLNVQPDASGSSGLDIGSSASTTTSHPGNASSAVLTPLIVVQFPSDLGSGQLDATAQEMVREVIRVMNLFLSKKEYKQDKGAEQLRRALDPVTQLYVYRNKNEAINVKPENKSSIFVGMPAQEVSYPAMFVELLRVLEMQDKRLTSSWERREQIGVSIRKFLDAYGKLNPNEPAIAELNALDVKTLTKLW